MAIVDTAVLIGHVQRLASDGVDYIQLRDPTASARTLLHCAHQILDALHGSNTRLLVNTRADIALAVGAHGVHLTSHAHTLHPEQVRDLYKQRGKTSPVISVSCHTLMQVAQARDARADMILFGPIFEKRLSATSTRLGVGPDALQRACACAGETRVLALGGVTRENAGACTHAGAAGIAGIRVFA